MTAADNRLFEAVRAYPAGKSTPARMALTARRFGYGGIIIRNGSAIADHADAHAICTEYDVAIAPAHELSNVDQATDSGRLPTLRKQRPVLIAHGGTTQLNRFLANQAAVDVLGSPFTNQRTPLEVGVVKAAAENGVHLELDLDPLRQPGGTRVRYIQQLMQAWKLIEKYNTPYVVSLSPSSHLEFCEPNAIEALIEAIGLDPALVRSGLCAWGEIARKNAPHSSEPFLEPDD